MKNSAIIQVENLSKSFPNQGKLEPVLQQISFRIEKGEIISILGQSGCGKSTLLNIIGGFEKPDKGHVLLDGNVVERPSRRCVMLFQHYGLLPWRSVLKNVELGLEGMNLTSEQRRSRAFDYLKLVGLHDYAERFPHELSGGMQQRVAIARALAIQPEVILMDEPFAALDTFNRYYLQDELLRLQDKEKTTIILVTHDIDEAVYLSDRVLIMSANPGRIHRELKIDTPRPRDRSHSDFQYYRKIILEEFHFHRPTPPIDYNI
ncbi:ABC transporter ATP-binding protein [Geobacillus sp. NFOSA3]|uniref:ABC transporter n=1 Tax=Parageobacillus galactosidasius TaxID=883812 RepID=A0A226QTV4_9BACL|nr:MULTISPECIES: ABC transporter ATP-binding protein [Parageobacillus]NNU94378.1 ABC transporter ATP-binding protein [Geobacillus sp. NFOSA3]OXB95010.1 ABC transporter [Parageobacillus galactosidasius]QSB47988.1 ABC transporter ATP-binding protein [Parageobacillus toebii]